MKLTKNRKKLLAKAVSVWKRKQAFEKANSFWKKGDDLNCIIHLYPIIKENLALRPKSYSVYFELAVKLAVKAFDSLNFQNFSIQSNLKTIIALEAVRVKYHKIFVAYERENKKLPRRLREAFIKFLHRTNNTAKFYTMVEAIDNRCQSYLEYKEGCVERIGTDSTEVNFDKELSQEADEIVDSLKLLEQHTPRERLDELDHFKGTIRADCHQHFYTSLDETMRALAITTNKMRQLCKQPEIEMKADRFIRIVSQCLASSQSEFLRSLASPQSDFLRTLSPLTFIAILLGKFHVVKNLVCDFFDIPDESPDLDEKAGDEKHESYFDQIKEAHKDSGFHFENIIDSAYNIAEFYSDTRSNIISAFFFTLITKLHVALKFKQAKFSDFRFNLAVSQRAVEACNEWNRFEGHSSPEIQKKSFIWLLKNVTELELVNGDLFKGIIALEAKLKVNPLLLEYHGNVAEKPVIAIFCREYQGGTGDFGLFCLFAEYIKQKFYPEYQVICIVVLPQDTCQLRRNACLKNNYIAIPFETNFFSRDIQDQAEVEKLYSLLRNNPHAKKIEQCFKRMIVAFNISTRDFELTIEHYLKLHCPDRRIFIKSFGEIGGSTWLESSPAFHEAKLVVDITRYFLGFSPQHIGLPLEMPRMIPERIECLKAIEDLNFTKILFSKHSKKMFLARSLLCVGQFRDNQKTMASILRVVAASSLVQASDSNIDEIVFVNSGDIFNIKSVHIIWEHLRRLNFTRVECYINYDAQKPIVHEILEDKASPPGKSLKIVTYGLQDLDYFWLTCSAHLRFVAGDNTLIDGIRMTLSHKQQKQLSQTFWLPRRWKLYDYDSFIQKMHYYSGECLGNLTAHLACLVTPLIDVLSETELDMHITAAAKLMTVKMMHDFAEACEEIITNDNAYEVMDQVMNAVWSMPRDWNDPLYQCVKRQDAKAINPPVKRALTFEPNEPYFTGEDKIFRPLLDKFYQNDPNILTGQRYVDKHVCFPVTPVRRRPKLHFFQMTQPPIHASTNKSVATCPADSKYEPTAGSTSMSSSSTYPITTVLVKYGSTGLGRPNNPQPLNTQLPRCIQ